MQQNGNINKVKVVVPCPLSFRILLALCVIASGRVLSQTAHNGPGTLLCSRVDIDLVSLHTLTKRAYKLKGGV